MPAIEVQDFINILDFLSGTNQKISDDVKILRRLIAESVPQHNNVISFSEYILKRNAKNKISFKLIFIYGLKISFLISGSLLSIFSDSEVEVFE